MSLLKKLIVSLAVACSPVLAQAQAYPSKPIRLVVPYSPGGGADNAARVIANTLSSNLGQQVVIENRPGGSGIIGAQTVARAEPDGYTVLYDASAFAVNPAIRKMPFDAVKDLMPVSLAVTVPNVFVVPPTAPYKTVQEFLDYARKNPGKLTYASYGAGSAAHLIGELLKNQAKIDLLHVPYKGGAPALTDVMGGQVDSYFANAASGLTYVKSGKLRALAVTSTKRMANLPDVPTLAESGFKNFEVLEWNGFFVPKGTPNDVVARLNKEIQTALKDAGTRQKLEGLGLDPIGSSPDEFAKFLQTEMSRWAALVKTNKISVD
ncbi:Bug family tripartite tricarboxylate transporter substrate binding protein [Noviherbaspirillum sp. Root189]|uniref:Bug family tripartite tricarboxylate transporter substrate binding protein n=1 Tax=Noviherbaspirillum sp. Root189 TaxID=1736487 RepID=UPI00070894A7|nr:tripartite tricarboxylate transporter substrate binding protein [Noviherbaspirillum sp. Root189]KRB82152.1 LacI family transcriptional regulator [Noviherbaspirillum sp. Root189]